MYLFPDKVPAMGEKVPAKPAWRISWCELHGARDGVSTGKYISRIIPIFGTMKYVSRVPQAGPLGVIEA
jgi:hypothetical protein